MSTASKSNVSNETKATCTEASVKTVIADPSVQAALRSCLRMPEQVLIKRVRQPYTPKDAKPGTLPTQKVEGIYGTSMMDADTIELTLVDIELKQDAINHMYRLVDYTIALNANMADHKFSGYAAKGFKLLVTRLERVDENETKNTAD